MDHGDQQEKFNNFQKCKTTSLNKEDLSLKGSIDEPIRALVNVINKSEYYYTTSTCSGRITLIEKPYGKPGLKKGNTFRLNSHYLIDYGDFKSVVDTFKTSVGQTTSLEEASQSNNDTLESNCLWLKFEPFIMHIQCYNLEKAKSLLNVVLASGCRNSGVTFGRPDKFLVAVRSTSSMEVPVVCEQEFNIQEDYIKFLSQESNRRLTENSAKLLKLQGAIEEELSKL